MDISEQTVVRDDKSDAEDIFKEETARISEHPVEVLHIPSEGPDHEQLGAMVEGEDPQSIILRISNVRGGQKIDGSYMVSS